MVDRLNPIFAIPQEVLSNFMRNNAAEGVIEHHRYVSVNGGIPKHIVDYQVYNKNGVIEKPQESTFDRMA